MHVTATLAFLAIASTLPLAAQTACTPNALENAAKTVATLRRTLHSQAVPEQDPNVPPTVAADLRSLKNTLTQAADAAFACALATSDPEALQTTLANALHANLGPATESITVSGKQDIGAYGSDLAVQVFQLTDSPKFFEVDFRYGIECGDDNLLLVYQAAPEQSHRGWHQILRWDVPTYSTVDGAFGDFVVLTPLTGDFRRPNWHFLVAHGRPGCASPPRPARFDLDLLTPAADPARPTHAWHFDHPYTQTDTTHPRLATTDDTVDFRLQSNAPKTEEIYRFRLTGNGQMEPLPADAPEESPAGGQQNPPKPSSPQ